MNNAQSLNELNGLEIAIIGLAGRFPGAKDIAEFWQNLKNGVESISFYKDEELLDLGVDSNFLNNPQYIKAGAKLADIDLFDASFFGYNPREAEIIDPQQRIFLECAWEALENSGYDSEKYRGAIAVYAGAGMNGYMLNVYSNQDLRKTVSNYQLFLASDKDFLTTRVSYKLDLEGPSVDVQTACSTSLVAVHLACQSLLSGECDIALAGGVAIAQQAGYWYQEGGVYSPDGHCRAFDAQGAGTVGGSGVGIVVLKRLEEALADGDCIHAIIKGSAINNDGALKVSYTAPRIDTQAKVIRAAQVMAEVEPETITYVEAHGTGTALGDPIEIAALTQAFRASTLGDPIEIAALTQAFRASTNKKGFCAIASVKTNIGHLDAAAGIASLIKTVLALEHQQIPPNLHFEHPNPQIDFENSPFYVNTRLSDWQRNSNPRRAGVSSFGIGGTNAHVILEEAPAVNPSSPSRPWQLLLLSAKTSTALETATANLATYLKQHPTLNLADVAYTLQVGRRTFNHRRMLLCQTLEEATEALQAKSPQILTRFQEPAYKPIVFMFPGQGTQYLNMGKELYQTEPIFREQVDRCCDLLQSYLDGDLREVLYPQECPLPSLGEGTGVRDYNSPITSLEQTAYAQPALFVIEYALAKLWMSWGIQPEAAIGHSIGEYVAACVAGVFSLEDALRLVTVRGKLLQQMPAGAMLSVALSQEEIEPWLSQDISLAASNAPSLCVVSGVNEAIAALKAQLLNKGIACRRLHTSHAFHSPLMEAAIAPFMEEVKKVGLNPPQIPFISNVTGTWITAVEATDPAYWAKHLRQTVQFSTGIAELLKEPTRILLEVGPGKTLSTLAKQHESSLEVLTSMRHPKDEQSDIALVLNTLGKLWLAGVTTNWSGFYANEQRHRIPLPTYPFERQRYWIEPQQPETTPITASSEKVPKPSNITDWFYCPSWERILPLEPIDWKKRREQKQTWLVFLDSYGVGAQISQKLENAGQDVVTVSVGEKFAQIGNRAFAIDPRNPDEYSLLLETLRLQGFTPEHVSHLWGITAEELETPIAFDKYQIQGFYSLLFLVQAIGKITTPLQMSVVTNHLHDVIGEENFIPEKTPLLGLTKVIGQEYPNIVCRSIDLITPERQTQQEQSIDRLIAELTKSKQAPPSHGGVPWTTQPTEIVVAHRGSHRWRQIYRAIPLDEPIKEKVRLRDKGTYLIAGTLLEGLGFVFAEFLAKALQAKLILVSNWALPEKNQWEQWLNTHEGNDEISHQITKIQTWESLGAECLVVQADVTNKVQMKKAIAEAEERFGDLHGVFYSTPMTNQNSASLAQEMSLTQCEYNFHTKVYGLYVLSRVLQGRQLDFCLLQSSLSSVLGGLGLGAYAAANSFIDAFARYQNTESSIPWFSVNWDACRSEEEQQESQGIGAGLAEFALTPSEVGEAIQRILSMGVPSQVIVSKGNLQERLEQWLKPELASTIGEVTSNRHARPNLANPYLAPRNEAEKTIANLLQEVLGIDKIGVYDSFFDLGGHSLLAIQVISRLRETFQVELPLRSILFEAPTVAALATAIAENRSLPDVQALTELLEEVKSLSPQEIEQQLTVND